MKIVHVEQCDHYFGILDVVFLAFSTCLLCICKISEEQRVSTSAFVQS